MAGPRSLCRMTRRPTLAASLIGLAMLAGCGPMTVEQAERACLDDLRDSRPQTRISMGVAGGSGGWRPHAGLEVSLSSDQIMGRDPAESYALCVQRRSGQPPRQPLYQQPGQQRG